jgi:hypothetical protein
MEVIDEHLLSGSPQRDYAQNPRYRKPTQKTVCYIGFAAQVSMDIEATGSP